TTTSNFAYINYTESTSGTSYPLNPPQVVTVHTYDDGSLLV
ncbi:8212_t:CDS:1, partial [Gigaspora rosea]